MEICSCLGHRKKPPPLPPNRSIPDFKGNRSNAQGPLAVENDAEFFKSFFSDFFLKRRFEKFTNHLVP